MKVSELEGAALDWAMAKAVGVPVIILPADNPEERWQVQSGMHTGGPYWPSQDWSQGGPLIDRFEMLVCPPEHTREYWEASVDGDCEMHYGRTALVAICRAVVASKLGEEVELPAGLVAV